MSTNSDYSPMLALAESLKAQGFIQNRCYVPGEIVCAVNIPLKSADEYNIGPYVQISYSPYLDNFSVRYSANSRGLLFSFFVFEECTSGEAIRFIELVEKTLKKYAEAT